MTGAADPVTGTPATVQPRFLRPTPLEVSTHIPFGLVPGVTLADGADRHLTPRQALEAAVLPALQRGPCVVSFSGGCDSSLVLAIATHVARREGLPDPIPVTHVFPQVATSDESSFQELIVSTLGLKDWQRMEWVDGEMEVLGPIARRFLAAFGVLLPFNAHFHWPIVEAGAGGSCLTGIGGDDALEDGDRVATARFLCLRRPERSLRHVAYGLLPAGLRQRRLVQQARVSDFTWLRPDTQRALEQEIAHWESREPLHQGRAMRWYWQSRLVQLGLDERAGLGRHFDAHVVDPLLSQEFLAARARDLRFAGKGNRRTVLQDIAGDVLPRA